MNIRSLEKIHRERRWCAAPEAKPLLAMPKWLLAETLIHQCALGTESYDDALEDGTAVTLATEEAELIKGLT